MKEIVARHGWPVQQMVGREGAHMAWLLVQHADHDVAFQKKCLKLMTPHMATGQVAKADVAYLTDRVRVNEGRQQLYGTQFHTVEGRHQPRPIQDADAVDTRRKAMGMQTLQEYTAMMHT